MGNKGAARSNTKIIDRGILDILKSRGEVKVKDVNRAAFFMSILRK
ncbi:MAG TPA: hypothetical protein GXX70_07420 [Tepidimicrobium sp.]|nr:hypothetical protein [Tepidimicrobium sp.]